MLKLILSRLAQGFLVLLVISLLIFVLLDTVGGDAVSALRDNPRVSEETIERLRRVYGLDRPLIVRYTNWLVNLTRGDLGQSLYFQAPVCRVIRPRLLRTAAMVAVAMAISGSIAILLGVAAARRSGGWVDRLCGFIILLAASTPRLVLALLALAIIARTTLFDSMVWNGPWLLRVLPPAFILSVPLIALFLAQTRLAIKMALEEEFVRTARSKGLPERLILLRHTLRPALNPIITIFGYSLGGLMSGSVIVEKVMNWPGLGQLSVMAVHNRDVPLLMGVVLVASAAVLIGNLVADVFLRLNDPRLR
jgi:peptide/nickel transport system permease protein